MKVKVVFGDCRLVVPCAAYSEKNVGALMEIISARLQTHLGNPKLRIKELWTNDGFFLHQNDQVDQVVDDGCILNALDYSTWLQQNLK